LLALYDRLVAIIWTASSDAARQACGEAAARTRWGNLNAQALTHTQISIKPEFVISHGARLDMDSDMGQKMDADIESDTDSDTGSIPAGGSESTAAAGRARAAGRPRAG
jgi:hypothetical protein